MVLRCSDEHVIALIEEGSLLAAPINDLDATQRKHRRVFRFSVEAWLMNKMEDEGGPAAIAFIPAEPKRDMWRAHLRKKQSTQETVKTPNGK